MLLYGAVAALLAILVSQSELYDLNPRYALVHEHGPVKCKAASLWAPLIMGAAFEPPPPPLYPAMCHSCCLAPRPSQTRPVAFQPDRSDSWSP
jgi:hypothetical protein